MIFDDVADIMSSKSVKQIRKITGLKRNRIYSLKCGCGFNLDYDLISGLDRLGYEIKVAKKSSKSGQAPDSTDKTEI